MNKPDLKSNIQGKALSLFTVPFFTPEAAAHFREEYFVDGPPREAFHLGMKSYAETGFVDWGAIAVNAPPDVMRYIANYVLGEYEVEIKAWIYALRDQYCARELAAAKSVEYDFPIDAVYGLSTRTREILEMVKGPQTNDLHENFRLFLDGEHGNPIPTGFSYMDSKVFCGGFFPGQNIIIGGDPGTGKTSLMLNMANNQGREHRVDFHSFELVPSELHRRLVSVNTGIDGNKIKRRDLNSTQRASCLDWSERVKDSKLRFPQTSGLSDLELSIKTSDAEIIYVDYLQRIPMPGNQSLNEKISRVSNTLNAAIKTTGKTLVLASSLNNEAMKGGNVGLTDYKGSGDIGYDADIAITLKFDGDKSHGLVKAFTPKNRDGESGFISLKFDMPCFRFFELDTKHAGPVNEIF